MATPKLIGNGTCELCGLRETAARWEAHLDACAPIHDAKGVAQSLTRLCFEGADDPRYWIVVEARTSAKLSSLDALLRQVWLECCGHMSAFRVGRSEISKSSTVGALPSGKGDRVSYDYDFGSTTTLVARVLGTRLGSTGRAVARVLARNDPPAWKCARCAKPATLICPFCDEGNLHTLCAEHADAHEHADEGVYLPVVNSPRAGVCGYTGD